MIARVLVIAALFAAACSSGGVSQEKLDAVADERNLAQVRLTETQVALAQLEDQVMTLEEKLRAAEIRAEISDRLREREAAEAVWAEFLEQYDAAWSSEDVAQIMELYDGSAVWELPLSGTIRRGGDDVALSFTNFLAGLEGYRQQTEEFAVIDANTALVMWEATARSLDGALVLLSGGSRLERDDDGEIIRHVDYAVFP